MNLISISIRLCTGTLVWSGWVLSLKGSGDGSLPVLSPLDTNTTRTDPREAKIPSPNRLHTLLHSTPSPLSASASPASPWRPISSHTSSRFRSILYGVICLPHLRSCDPSPTSSCGWDPHGQPCPADRLPKPLPDSSWLAVVWYSCSVPLT